MKVIPDDANLNMAPLLTARAANRAYKLQGEVILSHVDGLLQNLRIDMLNIEHSIPLRVLVVSGCNPASDDDDGVLVSVPPQRPRIRILQIKPSDRGEYCRFEASPMGLEADTASAHMTQFLRLGLANRAKEVQR